MSELYCFNEFDLDPAKRELRRDGVRVPIGATDLRLLLVLVENAGTIVAKDRLALGAWGTVAVTHNVLYVHLSALRKILGNASVVNEQRRGYRFALPVHRKKRRATQRKLEPRAGNLKSLGANGSAAGPLRLIGRTEHLRFGLDFLARGRLVTLTGPGGVGKTRLALRVATEVAQQFCDGVWLVELAVLSDEDLVPSAIASALGLSVDGHATPLDAISRYLARKSLLIVLDNCEHVVRACGRVAEALLSAAPKVKLLATSREALSCCGEQVLEVPPLALPSDEAMPADIIRSIAAIDLFIERARESDANVLIEDSDLALVAQICRRADGLPLAIEMVSGWTGLFGLEALNAKLDGSLQPLLSARSTAPPRHSTLHATLQWSFNLLSETEQVVLRRLSVFAGTFSLPAAEDVAGDNHISRTDVIRHLANLIRKSMIAVVWDEEEPRYRLLETMRAFMLEELKRTDDADPTLQRHVHHVLRALEAANSEWETTSDSVWLKRHGCILNELRAALDWALGRDTDDAVALAGASWPLWRELSLRTEGRRRLISAQTKLRPDTPSLLEARLRHGLGETWSSTAAMTTVHAEIERAVSVYRTLGTSPSLGSALTALGFVLLKLGRIEEAENAVEEALEILKATGWLRTLARAYSFRCQIDTARGQFGAALIAGRKAAELSEIAGADRTALVVAANLVQLSLEAGDFEGGISAGWALGARLRGTRHSDLCGYVMGVLAGALTAQGELDEALAAAREATPLLRDHGWLFWLFDHLALRAGLDGRHRDAVLIAGYADTAHKKYGVARERSGHRANERTASLLREQISDQEITELGRLGAQLSEDQAIGIALGL